ncbi:hypothetical protein [Bradyrhizobium cenepequi]|uniref:hypothetical protein n=1 Tax=Bradyrhizobium cenepequi TaxID=2821403 RepID=UPI001CE2B4E8|nr:hypothetical protein [Bradyrhizobium cenepequi]MCA6110439.1 hypothetical protein [Bradyrhizobium cenepequi]
MTLQIREIVPTRIDWCVSAIIGNTMPPLDPDDDEEDDDQDDEENGTDEPPVVREPDQD